MCYGKEIFRGKYKETMDSLNIIKDNYYDLDQEYQCSMKEKNDEIERLKGVYKKNLELVDKMYSKDKEIERLNNIINGLEKKIISICETCYEDRETARIEKWIKELRGSNDNE